MSTTSEPVNDSEPLRKLNPKPLHAYEIRMVVENAPGPFVTIEGVAQYDVKNPECGDIDPVIGAIPRITSNEVFTLDKVSDREYAGVIYTDRILDEDYYGNGVCQWGLAEARVVLKGMTGEESSRFVSDLPAEAIQAQGAKKKYFWKGYYPKAGMSGFPDFGVDDLKTVPADKAGEFFTISLSAKELGS